MTMKRYAFKPSGTRLPDCRAENSPARGAQSESVTMTVAASSTSTEFKCVVCSAVSSSKENSTTTDFVVADYARILTVKEAAEFLRVKLHVRRRFWRGGLDSPKGGRTRIVGLPPSVVENSRAIGT
jgi:hypothetical protein